MATLIKSLLRFLMAPRPAKAAGLSVVGLALMSVAAGCSAPGNDYAEYANLPEDGWKYGDTLTFTPVHPDSLCRGRLVVGVRHIRDFPYTSLWLETIAYDNGRPKTDTLEIPLADGFGSWRGQGIGASYQMADTVEGGFLHVSGSPVRVRHIMRADTLRGVTQVGIFFVPEDTRQ